MLLEKEKKYKVIELIEKKGFPELKEWLKSKSGEFKKNLGRNFEKNIPMIQRLLLEKTLEKLLPKLTKALGGLQIENFTKSDCQIISELANNFLLKEVLPESNFKKSMIEAVTGGDEYVRDFLQGKVKINFCWTSLDFTYDHYDCLPLNSDWLFLKILLNITNQSLNILKNAKEAVNGEQNCSSPEVIRLRSEIKELNSEIPILRKERKSDYLVRIKIKEKEEELNNKERQLRNELYKEKVNEGMKNFEKEVKERISEEIYQLVTELPRIAYKILTEKRISELKSKLKKKKVRTEELRDYFNYKVRNPNDNFTEWEKQIRNGDFPPSVAGDSQSYSEVLEGIIDDIARRKEYIIKIFTPQIEAEKGLLTDKEIQLIKQEVKDIPIFTESSFFEPEVGVGRMIKQRKKLNEIFKLIEKEDLSDLDDEDLIHLIRRLERIQKHAKYPTILVSGKSIELTNLEKLNQLIKQLRSRVSEKRMSEADETKEEAVIRELKEMGIRIEPKLSGESKRLLGEIRSDKSKIFTAYKVEKFKKDIKEATIAWLKEKMEQKKVDKDKNLSRYKKLSSNSQKVYSDKAISSPFGGGKKFESIPEITKKILEDIEKTSSEYKK